MKTILFLIGLSVAVVTGVGFITEEPVVAPFVPQVAGSAQVVVPTVRPPTTDFSVQGQVKPVEKTPVKIAEPKKDVQLSNDNYYTNVEGNKVHSPAYANDVPPGASAICRDGTYSFSQNRRGTCSGHGGVEEWL